jgi:DNA polymerase-1
MSDKVYLIDGSGYIFRAYYGVAPLTTREGFPTNALFGFLRMIIKLLATADSDKVVMVFDAGKETFRTEMYPEYKANRDECPEDLLQQMPYFRDFSRALGLPVFEQIGVEADDIIGTLVKRFHGTGIETVIVSGDKDLMQLVDDSVTIWDTMRDRRFGPKEVEEKMGVPPEKIIELLGLMGDSSDNIPGIRGVGPKTAVKLLELFGSIDKVIESTDEIRETKAVRGRLKIADAIEEDTELLRLSRRLVEIKTDVEVLLTHENSEIELGAIGDDALLPALQRQDPDAEMLADLAERFEFHSLLKEFQVTQASSQVDYDKLYKVVDKDSFDTWLTKLNEQDEVAFDLEATSLDTLSADIVGFAFSWSTEEGWYIPVGHAASSFSQVSLEDALKALTPWFQDVSKRKVGQNLKYDTSLLARYDVEVAGVYFDTMLASYVLNPERSSHSLNALSKEFLGRAPLEYGAVTEGLSSFAEVPVEQATHYAAEDAHLTWLLYCELKPELEKAELLEVFDDIEVPLVSVLARMERAGIAIDTDLLAKMSKELEGRLEETKIKVFELAGEEFNPNSPKQLSTILFDKLGISTQGVKKTKTGYSTDSSVLERLRHEHELPDQILIHRGLAKLKNTYVDVLPEQVSEVSGRLHTSFNQTVTATGRLSSSDPNLQNIPIQSEDGRKVRKAFVSKPGSKLISADYSQIELRLLAHMSDDVAMIQAFDDERDIHSETAKEIMGLNIFEEVTPELRRIGKTINFGVVYGMSGFRLARDLGIPVSEGNRYIKEYFNRYSGVREYFKELEQRADSDGYVSTLFGRRRYIPASGGSSRDQGFRRRIAINAPIQGSAADLIKLAMINIDKRIQKESLPLRMLLQIHDELVFECDEGAVDECCDFVKSEMEQVISLKVPLKVDMDSGVNWYEAH